MCDTESHEGSSDLNAHLNGYCCLDMDHLSVNLQNTVVDFRLPCFNPSP